MNRQQSTITYMTIVILAGVICLAAAIVGISAEKLDWRFLLLGAFTIGVGSRISVQIPRFKSHVSVSDTFIFLALLIYGGEAAVILAAADALCSSWRFCNKKITIFFNAAAMAVSTTAAVLVLKASGFYSESQLHGYNSNVKNFLIALSVLAVTQFLSNTALASLYDSIKNDISWRDTWKSKYVWAFLTYFIGAASAGLLVQLSDTIGFGIIIATFPVIFFLFLTYKMYLQNVEMSIRQAEQAEEHAEVLKKQSDALRESEERFRSAFHHAPIGIALLSASGKWLKVNQALCRILGYAEEEFLATDLDAVIFPEDLGNTVVKIRQVVSGNAESWQDEQRYLHKTGRTVWALWSLSAVKDAERDSSNLILQLQDITDKKVAEEKLHHEATHDALTGLPNRAMFMGKLSEALLKMKEQPGYQVTVLFIDLDRFKYVNDSLGHIVGDQLLVEISKRLSQCLRPSDMVARLGGDEFVILVEGRYEIKETIAIAERIQHKFGLPFVLRGNELYSTASIGILHASAKHLTSEDMMRDADTAMYQAKRAGKARHEVFNEAMHTAAIETLQLETDLRRAIERCDFSVEYQPIFSVSAGRIEGVHAAPRWDHPKHGKVDQRRIITLAEEIGVIDTLSKSVLRQACDEIHRLEYEGPDETPLFLCVNLSSRQFVQASLVDAVKKILSDTGFAPRRLKLEISESAFLLHQERAVHSLTQISELGVELKVGDFGTGYSNLNYLMRLPFSTLKIDRSFTATIGQTGSPEIVRAIATLARNIGLKVVVEGVETPEQIEELKRLNCDSAYGKLFGEPMTFDQLKQYISEYVPQGLPDVGFQNAPAIPLVQ